MTLLQLFFACFFFLYIIVKQIKRGRVELIVTCARADKGALKTLVDLLGRSVAGAYLISYFSFVS